MCVFQYSLREYILLSGVSEFLYDLVNEETNNTTILLHIIIIPQGHGGYLNLGIGRGELDGDP